VNPALLILVPVLALDIALLVACKRLFQRYCSLTVYNYSVSCEGPPGKAA
jgi:hypothetical protein